jgi:hypothetical protein
MNMIAIQLTSDVILAGVEIPAHGTIEVVDELPFDEPDAERAAVTAAQARALVGAGYAQPVTADFETFAATIEAWRA